MITNNYKPEQHKYYHYYRFKMQIIFLILSIYVNLYKSSVRKLYTHYSKLYGLFRSNFYVNVFFPPFYTQNNLIAVIKILLLHLTYTLDYNNSRYYFCHTDILVKIFLHTFFFLPNFFFFFTNNTCVLGFRSNTCIK